jgi:hypothetical protein
MEQERERANAEASRSTNAPNAETVLAPFLPLPWTGAYVSAMAAPALRPRSPSEIVDAAFQILRAHYGQLVTCSAIAYAPLLLLRLLVVGDPMRFLGADPMSLSSDVLPATLTAVLGGWLTFSLMSAVLIVCASQAYLGEPVDAGAALRRALPRIPQVLGAALLRFLFMAVGFVLLVFPVLYAVALLFAMTPLIVLERADVATAVRRSAALSKGRKWHVLNTLGLVAIIYYVLVLGFSLLASLVGEFVVGTIVSSVVTVLVYPVVAITEALLYYDARIQAEGLDIQLMTEALGPLPVSRHAVT